MLVEFTIYNSTKTVIITITNIIIIDVVIIIITDIIIIDIIIIIITNIIKMMPLSQNLLFSSSQAHFGEVVHYTKSRYYNK